MGMISVDPDPLVAGQPGKVCYDFGGSGLSSVDLDVRWTPLNLGSQIVTVTNTGASGPICASISGGVPATATSVTIHDQTGSAPDYGDIVEQPGPG